MFIAIALFLIQCTATTKITTTNSSTPINDAITEQQQATDLIAPYKQQLDAEMNEVLVISSEEFPKEKGKTQTKLGNLVADLSLEVAQKMYADTIDFCLLNFHILVFKEISYHPKISDKIKSQNFRRTNLMENIQKNILIFK